MNFLPSAGTLAGASCTSNYGAWNQALAAYHASDMGALALGDLGRKEKISKSKNYKIGIRKKRRVSEKAYKDALKYKAFKGEDRRLKKAFEKKDLRKAKVIMLKLARIRDRLRRKALRKEGRRETKGRLRRIERVRKKSNAADTIIRYWKGKFADSAKAVADKAKKADAASASGEEVPEEFEISPEEQALLAEAQQSGQQLDMLDLPGFTDNLPQQPGEEEVSEALIAEMESDESEDFGTPFLDQEYGEDPGLGALALGYLGGLFS